MEINRICTYLKDVLTFRDYIEIPENINDCFYISNDELRYGKISVTNDLAQIIKKWHNGKSEISKNGDADKDKYIDVLLIPKTVCDLVPTSNSMVSVNKESVWEYKKVSLLYIKAKLNVRTYILFPVKNESLIWADPVIKAYEQNPVKRLLLKFINRLFNLNCADHARFELKTAPSLSYDGDDWGIYISKVAENFNRRTGYDIYTCDSLADEHNVIHPLYDDAMYGKTVVMKDPTVFASFNIMNLLSGIITCGEKLPLLETMLSGNRNRETVFRYDSGKKLSDHAGQMKNEYPLARAQRLAVHAFSSLGNGEVLAVSGPPGTGKTTMLQSIVADMNVKMTLRNKGIHGCDTAPLILATSANNKAITNIIDAFSSSDIDTSEIAIDRRWLLYEADRQERFVPMAVYFPSSSVSRRKIQNYFVTDYNGGDDYGALRMHYHKDPSDFFRRASEVLGHGCCSLDSVMESLSDEIDRYYRCLRGFEASHKDYGELKEELLASYPECIQPTQAEKAHNLDELLDLTVRYRLYWLSVHYNECRWLRKLESQTNDDGSLRKVYGKFLFEEIKYICPCIISTFYMAPRLFGYSRRKDGRMTYNYALADLLIVDEAGQVSPEIGLPTFALAKKAIVVGDVKQIPPVQGIHESTDEAYWRKNMTGKRNGGLRDLLSCAGSNIMAIAEKCCRYQREDAHNNRKDGLFLDEHRRCVDEIIDYSNKLIYEGELKPKTGPAKDKCRLRALPPMGIFVNESESKTKDGSRYNREEVKAIKKFIASHSDEILEAYTENGTKPELKDLICIITPFKAQSVLIQKDPDLCKFPVGTVHTFQGAESPIVIFSMVYGRKDNPAFIKNNHELMNVAVSRAKHHFIAIGSRGCLERHRSDNACGLLYEKLEVLPQNISGD